MSESASYVESSLQREDDPQLELLQQLASTLAIILDAVSTQLAVQIKENEFLQRENLLLEAYLAKIDFSKAGIDIDDEPGKVSWWHASKCGSCAQKCAPCFHSACVHACKPLACEHACS